ncbi:hypothetical protein [Labrenzia sp. PHM005]|uniref:hypothetical protein n=1 Tax=Labrenzia sp. PHM005 TaxID=2590016 RepID=UPI00113FE6FE|nr:hypothetical protein [Labrenzia sp. PHM005]QDG74399.1 hypothetical protein FJ695_00095 [Labrenzia sp. PHM005]
MSKTIRAHFIAITAVFAEMLLSAVSADAAEFKKMGYTGEYDHEQMLEKAREASKNGNVVVFVNSKHELFRKAVTIGFKKFTINALKAGASNDATFTVVYGEDVDGSPEIQDVDFYINGINLHSFRVEDFNNQPAELAKATIQHAEVAINKHLDAMKKTE